ncbi:hypothetical protein ACFUGD_02010 [Streptomyces sp. NPDC057217]|uniref:hypothetical protein n=1 Tax=Streptomyces sp. NPDC057217 TaxID=3346054 RepID=UPI003632B93F
MTGPEHYRKAEQLLAEATTDGPEGVYFVRPENLAAAQVHATLALAAAAAGQLADRYVGDGDHITSWHGVTAKTLSQHTSWCMKQEGSVCSCDAEGAA